MQKLPLAANLIEVGLRDGIQSEKIIIPTSEKVSLISHMNNCGIKMAQVTSFVHPKKVPQMADAENFLAAIADMPILCSGLVLNKRGLERALDTQLKMIDLSMSLSNTHSQKNTGLSLVQAHEDMLSMVEIVKKVGKRVRLGLQCVFGCAFEGHIPLDRILEVALDFSRVGVDYLSLADTTGMANPQQVERVLTAIKGEIADVPLICHFHDNRGLAMANMYAALKVGVNHFDTSMGGVGGCPALPHASGNLATEDAAACLEAMGISTGIDVAKFCQGTAILEQRLGRQLAGKVRHLYVEEKVG